MHVDDFFKTTRVPEVNRFLTNFYQKELVENVSKFRFDRHTIPLHIPLFNVAFDIFVMAEKLNITGFVGRLFGTLRNIRVEVLLFETVQIWVFLFQKLGQTPTLFTFKSCDGCLLLLG